ncbi:MAG TPA: hypothetical protein VFA07_02920 [Chthonomonadaceae bacterium]|nr:hypothetical protein [Chthonomonadaceae bacterium]
MQTRHRLAPILPLSVLGGLALVCGMSGPAAAQDNTQSTTTQTTTQQATPTTTVTQTTTTQTTTTNPPYYETRRDYWNSYYALPEPLKYPEWSPGVINTLHWTDWTETNWAPGSTYDVELDRMKAEREFWANREKNGAMTAYYEPSYEPGYQQSQAYYYREEAPPAGPAFYGGESMAASGDFVYTVEDDTLYQMRASDLSLVTQHSLPTTTSTDNMGRWSSVAASGSFVYLLRGDTLYQFRTSDLSQANTATLPAPNTTATTPPPSRRMRGMGMGRRAVAASGDFVFVKRGNTLYQFRASDLSLVTQTPMPIPNANTPTAPAAGTP